MYKVVMEFRSFAVWRMVVESFRVHTMNGNKVTIRTAFTQRIERVKIAL